MGSSGEALEVRHTLGCTFCLKLFSADCIVKCCACDIRLETHSGFREHFERVHQCLFDIATPIATPAESAHAQPLETSPPAPAQAPPLETSPPAPAQAPPLDTSPPAPAQAPPLEPSPPAPAQAPPETSVTATLPAAPPPAETKDASDDQGDASQAVDVTATENKDKEAANGEDRSADKPDREDREPTGDGVGDVQGEKVMTCHLCNKSFTTIKGVLRHFQTLHNMGRDIGDGSRAQRDHERGGCGEQGLVQVKRETAGEHADKEKDVDKVAPLKVKKEQVDPDENFYIYPEISLDHFDEEDDDIMMDEGDEALDDADFQFEDEDEYDDEDYAMDDEEDHEWVLGGERSNAEPRRGNVKATFSKHEDGTSITFTCDECSNIFDSEQNVKRHIRNVHMHNYTCKYCDNSFRSRRALGDHMRRTCKLNPKRKKKMRLKAEQDDAEEEEDENESESRREFCNECQKYVLSLKRHNKKVHQGEPTKCKECDAVFKCETYMLDHLKRFHEEGRSEMKQCTYCDFKSTSAQVNIHMREAHGVEHKPRTLKGQTYRCCRQVFLTRSALKEHKETEEHKSFIGDLSKLECCNKTFKTELSLRKHREDAHSTDQVKCPRCDNVYKCKRYMLEHIKRTHDKVLKKCPHCEYTGYSLHHHIATQHTEHASFTLQCDMCPKTFKRPNDVKRHKDKVHLSNGSFVCDTCGKSYKNKVYLQNHVKRTHPKEEDMKHCPMCDYKASTMASIKSHIACIHEGLKPYVCQFCGKQFSQAGNLDLHVRTMHTVNKDWKYCPQCSYKAVSTHTIKKHIEIVHLGIRRYVCPYCNKRSSTSSGHKKHLASIHNEENSYSKKPRKRKKKVKQEDMPFPFLNERVENDGTSVKYDTEATNSQPQ